jgi:hypothetical protein
MSVSPFSPNSRYYGVAIRGHAEPDGTVIAFVGRRIIPEMQAYTPLDRHRTDGVERIDAVAAEFYGDALQYWRICDANGVEDPAVATAPEGRVLVVPLPLEVSGHGNA